MTTPTGIRKPLSLHPSSYPVLFRFPTPFAHSLLCLVSPSLPSIVFVLVCPWLLSYPFRPLNSLPTGTEADGSERREGCVQTRRRGAGASTAYRGKGSAVG